MCIYRHPLIEGMLMLLPEHPGDLAEVDLARWLRGFEANLRLLYDVTPQASVIVGLDYGVDDPALVIRPVVEEPSYPDDTTPAHGVPRLLSQLRDDLVDAHAEADRLEAQRYNADELEREAMRPGPPPWTGAERRHHREPWDERLDRRRSAVDDPPTPLERVRRGISEGGAYSRDGRFAKRLACPFPLEAPGLPGTFGPCAKACSGEVGLVGHLARAHRLTGAGAAVTVERNRLVAEAVAAGEAALAAELEPELMGGANGSHPAQVDLEPYADDVADDVLQCPFELPPDGVACGRPHANAVDLENHLRRAHRLGDDQGRYRVDLVDQALDELDARIAAPKAAAAGTMVDTAASADVETTGAGPEGMRSKEQ